MAVATDAGASGTVSNRLWGNPRAVVHRCRGAARLPVVARHVIPLHVDASSPSPWQSVAPLSPDVFAQLRRRVIFDCCKWDPQVEDVSTIADIPLVLPARVWRELAVLAELLAREAMAAETELRGRPDLHSLLGLPRAVRRALGDKPDEVTKGFARIVRFDFHHTTEGWTI